MNEEAAIYNIVTIKNPDVKPIEVVYNKVSYGTIEPGEYKKLPDFLARHATKHLINQILTRLNIPVNNMEKREEWAKKIVVDYEEQKTTAKKTKEELMQEQIDKLNQQLQQLKGDEEEPKEKTQLDKVLDKNKKTEEVEEPEGNGEPPEEIKEAVEESKSKVEEQKEIPDGVDPEIAEATKKQAEEKVEANKENGEVEKDVIIMWLQDEMKLNMEDKKTKEYIENKTAEELAKEFNYYELKSD